ncbi:MAG: lysoplasmalogenase family protein [Eubacteriales bacterium]|nr:lysoplasmalogenase family protein [Eubacteriales bacterium]MDD4324131.1 lysoplasmalogenase family protein [Eubacteriales bacterium]MDD4541144.1 lysoplasmalogenase family protein [Eubacteriales bacterium]
MDNVSYSLLALTVLSSTVFVCVSKGQKGIKSLVFKAIASFLFTLLGLYAAFSHGFDWTTLLFVTGFIASCFGDFILALPEWPELRAKKQELIMFGGLSFALAHTAYYIGMIILFGWAWWTLLIALFFAALFYFFNKLVMDIDYGKLAPGIFLYALFVSIVLCQGLYALVALKFNLYSILVASGFFFFYVSDVILMQIYFDEKRNTVKAYNFNLGFYYVAQTILATSLYFIK